MTTASGWRSYSANSRENLNSNGISLTAAGRIRSIRDSSITQKRSLVTIEPVANCQHAGEHMSGYVTLDKFLALATRRRRSWGLSGLGEKQQPLECGTSNATASSKQKTGEDHHERQ